MIVAGDKRVVSRMGVGAFRGLGANQYAPAVASGVPGGSATMTFFTVFQMRSFVPGFNYMFSSVNASTTAGWVQYVNGSAQTIRCAVANGAGANVDSLVRSATAADLGQMLVFVSTLAGGNLISSVSTSSVTTAVVGYTANDAAQRLRIGSWASSSPAAGIQIFDCGIMQGYDSALYVSAIFGNGQAGLVASMKEDLQQGRAITWPRVAAANSDWYWHGGDIVGGGGTVGPNWTDRYTGLVCVRTGSPQPYALMPRY